MDDYDVDVQRYLRRLRRYNEMGGDALLIAAEDLALRNALLKRVLTEAPSFALVRDIMGALEDGERV